LYADTPDLCTNVDLDGESFYALQGNVVFVRFYEAEGSGMDRRTPPSTDEYKRLKAAADACADIPTIMASLPDAIKNAVKQSRNDV